MDRYFIQWLILFAGLLLVTTDRAVDENIDDEVEKLLRDLETTGDKEFRSDKEELIPKNGMLGERGDYGKQETAKKEIEKLIEELAKTSESGKRQQTNGDSVGRSLNLWWRRRRRRRGK